jgi:hypothetical protein
MKSVLCIPDIKKFGTYTGGKTSVFAATGWLHGFQLWFSLLSFTVATRQSN